MTELPPKIECELGPTVGDDVTWKSMQSEHLKQHDICCFLGCGELVQGNESWRTGMKPVSMAVFPSGDGRPVTKSIEMCDQGR